MKNNNDYLDRLMASIEHTVAMEGLKGKDDTIPHDISYKNKTIDVDLKDVNKDSYFREKRTVYEIIKDRMYKTLDNTLSAIEIMMLKNETMMTIEFINYNIADKNYKDALMYSQRLVKNCELFQKHDPMDKDADFLKRKAEATVRERKIYWEFPKQAELITKMDNLIREEKYEEAGEINKKLNLSIQL